MYVHSEMIKLSGRLGLKKKYDMFTMAQNFHVSLKGKARGVNCLKTA